MSMTNLCILEHDKCIKYSVQINDDVDKSIEYYKSVGIVYLQCEVGYLDVFSCSCCVIIRVDWSWSGGGGSELVTTHSTFSSNFQ